MRNCKIYYSLLCSAFIACASESSEEAPANNLSMISASKFLHAQQRPIPGQYIVVLAEPPVGTATASVSMIANQLTSRYGGSVLRTYEHALRGFSLQLNEQQARQLAEDPAVRYVEEDGVVAIHASQGNVTWGLDRVDQSSLPLNQTYQYNLSGDWVNAYILDTGIRITHNDFGGRAFSGFTAINDGNGTNDCDGHGTHVAGTVGSSTWGVAKNVRLHAVRVLDCMGNGTWSGVIDGIDWVTANHVKPAVANMSLGGGAVQAVDDAVQNSVAAGVTYVVAAGNDNRDACSYSPARAPNAITVGSTDSGDRRSGFSNHGSCIDIFAPGSDITSTYRSSNTSTYTMSGTSMAAPHVAGAAALYLEFNPQATPAMVAEALFGYSSANKVSDPRTGSPNRLLFSNPHATSAGVISAKHSAQCLTVSNGSTSAGATVVQGLCSGAGHQVFDLVSVGREFQFVAGHSGQCLNVSGSSAGALVNQQPCTGATHQTFSLVSTGNDFFRFVAKHSGQCLTVTRSSTAPGESVTQEPCDGSSGQSFKLN